MLRRSLASGLIRALAGLLFGTMAGRWLAAIVTAIAAWSLVGGDAKRSGTWSGLANYIAPNKGSIEIEGAPGKSATCTVRGQTGSASGAQWVFRGNATVEETSCEGSIEKNG